MTAAISAGVIVLLIVAAIVLIVVVARSSGKHSSRFAFSKSNAEGFSAGRESRSNVSADNDLMTRRRLFGFMAFIGAAIGVLVVKLWSMQIVSGAEYTKKAEGNRITEYTTIAPRGRIYDRNGVELVGNRATFAVLANSEVQNDRNVLQRLSDVLGIPRETVKKDRKSVV